MSYSAMTSLAEAAFFDITVNLDPSKALCLNYITVIAGDVNIFCL